VKRQHDVLAAVTGGRRRCVGIWVIDTNCPLPAILVQDLGVVEGYAFDFVLGVYTVDEDLHDFVSVGFPLRELGRLAVFVAGGHLAAVVVHVVGGVA